MASSDQSRDDKEAEALTRRFLLLPPYQRAAVSRFVRMLAEGNAAPPTEEPGHVHD